MLYRVCGYSRSTPFLPVVQVNHRLSEDPHHVQTNHGIHDLGAVTERLTLMAMKKIIQIMQVVGFTMPIICINMLYQCYANACGFSLCWQSADLRCELCPLSSQDICKCSLGCTQEKEPVIACDSWSIFRRFLRKKAAL